MALRLVERDWKAALVVGGDGLSTLGSAAGILIGDGVSIGSGGGVTLGSGAVVTVDLAVFLTWCLDLSIWDGA